MGLFSVISLAADAASGSAGAGPGIMVVPALCALLYMSLKGLPLNLYILAKEVDPPQDYLGLGLWDSYDEGAGKRVLA